MVSEIRTGQLRARDLPTATKLKIPLKYLQIAGLDEKNVNYDFSKA
jgi:hypothetical protein